MNKIGRYDIISELGRGAMGIVYRASDPANGREVALKVLSFSASPEEGFNSPQQSFMREVRVAARLSHPSIAAIHDVFEDQETHTCCVAMEMVPGVTLEKILESPPPLTSEQSLDILRQVAEGLDYAHRNQVIHRDLKPANILVTLDGRVKITDFGIAKVLAREGVARTIGVTGTPSYMSPEQVKGSELDARTDLFSLGIVVFTMLAGKKPFTGNTAAVMFKIVYEEPPAVSTLNPELTSAYDDLVKRCLAKDVNRRYSSARELLDDLDDLQHGRPLRSQAGVPARPTATSPAPTRSPTRAAAPPSRTVAVPSPGHMTSARKPWRPPAVPLQAGGSATTASPGWTPPGQPPRLAATSPVAPAPRVNAPPRTGQTLQVRTPDVSGVIPAVPARPTFAGPTLIGRGLPAQAPPAGPVPPSPVPERMRAVPAPGLSTPPPAACPLPPNLAPPLRTDVALPGELTGSAPTASGAPKSKVVPVALGGVAVLLVAAAILGYWGFRRARSVAPPRVQVAVQTTQAPAPQPPPPNTAPVEPVVPPVATTEQPPPVSPAPEVVKKTSARKPKQSAVQGPGAPEPPPATQTEPTVATPPPQPAAPSSEDVAKAEAARLVSIPRIVQVVCNYGLKEATFIFSSGGRALFEETLKGKKVKGGFLGIKGSYQGSFSHTITVPTGVSEVSVRVLARDRATDLTKAVKMPPPGGFVPTLAVEVDNDHLSLDWKGSAPK